ncbi:MAG: ATP synthase F1 subunit delta [Bdellovibrionales bacterium]|nr:ATP synthase F1 subunit delta [Bdellovibrionales bacterium]
MSKIDGKTAKRYARAFFEAVDPAKLEDVQNSLGELVQAWEDNQSLQDALLSPAVTQAEKLAVISDICETIRPSDVHFKNFASLLLENHRLPGIAMIYDEFVALVDDLRNRLAMKISSAYPIAQDEQEAIQKDVQSKFGSLASIEWVVSPELIGGLKVKVGDRVLDSSIQGGLHRAKAHLLA